MKQYRLLLLFVSVFIGSYAQDGTTPIPNWNGDPKLCTVDPSAPSTSDRIPPSFPNQAEFTLERIEIKHIADITLPSQLTIYQYLYDYIANKLILVKNGNGFIDAEYFYYDALKKSTYYRGQYCVVTNLDTNNDMDGTSAVQFPNRTWHIRPLNEFLLFSNNDPSRPIVRPKYIGQGVIRGIPVDNWESCIIDKTQFKTVKRVWSFAQKGVVLPTGVVGDSAVPIQAIINASISFPNGTQAVDFDEIFNVYSYRPGIVETNDQIVPPKGVFCDAGLDQNLVSLKEAGIDWPRRYSVRIEASSTRTSNWQRFHLRYDRLRDSRRIRYDFFPAGLDHFQTVIHDYGDNLTYVIDRELGTCNISRGVEIPDVTPRSDPIRFFIKNEEKFLFTSGDRVWEFNGFRQCRGNAIKCVAVTTSFENFPPLLDPDTGKPNGETWLATNMEYGWSIRSPTTRPPDGTEIYFDYPVYLFLRMYRFANPSNPSPNSIITEEVEYEFYEMSHETRSNDFDTSICYRSLNYEYLHLGLTLRANDNDAVDGNHLNRRLLERELHRALTDTMQIRYSRVTDIEIDHDHANDDITILFTLLGPTPRPESASGVTDGETTAQQAYETLRQAVQAGTFQFKVSSGNNSNSDLVVQALRDTLKSSKFLLSSHAIGKTVITEKYSRSAEAGGVIGGALVGLVLGVLIAAIFRIVRKDPMPEVPAVLQNKFSISNPLPKISYYNTKATNAKKPTTETTTTTDA